MKIRKTYNLIYSAWDLYTREKLKKYDSTVNLHIGLIHCKLEHTVFVTVNSISFLLFSIHESLIGKSNY